MDINAFSLPSNAAAAAADDIFMQIRGRPLPTTDRPPVHFIAVLDRSGSMGTDGRLGNCLDSLRFLSRFLTAADRLSLITFNDVARVCMAATPMDAAGAATLETNLNIAADGGTSISGAIACIEECLTAAANAVPPFKTGILFLTDGNANEGVTDPAALQQMLRNILVNTATVTAGSQTLHSVEPLMASMTAGSQTLHSVEPLMASMTVSTIGYGCDHNVALLQGIAEQNAGSYNVVNDRENVASVFGHLLGGLMSCVASNVRINTPIETTALPTSLQMVPALDGIDICVGDIYAETTTEVLASTRAGLSELIVRSYDIATGRSRHDTVPIVPATEAICRQVAIFRLRQDVAALLHELASASAAATPALLIRITTLQNNCVRLGTDPIITMLNRQLGEAADVLRRGVLNAEARTLIAQNSAYTQMGRGLRAMVSAASTVEADFAADEDPFSSPVMRVVSGITATLSRGVAEPAELSTPFFSRQAARRLTSDEAAAAVETLPYLQASPTAHPPLQAQEQLFTPLNAASAPLLAPPPLYRMQYATHLFADAAAAVADVDIPPLPTTPLTRQIAAASRQTSNVSNNSNELQPQRLAFNSPILTGSPLPSNIPSMMLP